MYFRFKIIDFSFNFKKMLFPMLAVLKIGCIIIIVFRFSFYHTLEYGVLYHHEIPDRNIILFFWDGSFLLGSVQGFHCLRSGRGLREDVGHGRP